MGKDLLSGSRHRRSSHAKDEFTSVTVRKDDPKEKAGIRLEMESNGRVKVTNIAKNGLFADSEVEIGDIVLSINGKRLSKGEGAETMIDVIARAKSKVTVVVKKTNVAPRVAEKVKRDLSGAEDNNVKKLHTFYVSEAQHKEDGSLAISNDKAKEQKKKVQVVSTTISANKEDQPGDGELDETAGIELVVQSKKMFVNHISKTSIFQTTDLEVGDRVLSINDCNFREFADAGYGSTIVRKAKNAVTLVVDKGADGFTPVAPSTGKEKPTRRRSRSNSSRASRTSRTSKSGGKESKTTLKRMPKRKSNESIVSDLDSTDSFSEGSFGEEEFGAALPMKQNEYREIVIAAPKEFSKQEVGVTFDQKKNKYLAVHKIRDSSIFVNTSLEPGDIILEINDIDFRRKPDKLKALKACMKTKETVTFLVWKARDQKFEQKEFNLDASTTNLEWQ